MSLPNTFTIIVTTKLTVIFISASPKGVSEDQVWRHNWTPSHPTQWDCLVRSRFLSQYLQTCNKPHSLSIMLQTCNNPPTLCTPTSSLPLTPSTHPTLALHSPANAPLPMLVIPAGSVREVIPVQPANVSSQVLIIISNYHSCNHSFIKTIVITPVTP